MGMFIRYIHHVLSLIHWLCTNNISIHCILHLETTEGLLIAEEPNPAVPDDVLMEVWRLRQDHIADEDIISRLRSRTVPSGYSFHSWKPLAGKVLC